MENASYVSLARQMGLWRQMDSLANNMANTNTPGYQGEKIMFTDYLAKTRNPESPFRQKVAFSQDIGVVRDTSSGPLRNTGNPLDVALKDEGYFSVLTPEGEMFTRAGHFKLDVDGQLVTSDGHTVLSDADQPFFFAPNEAEISISASGTVSTENGAIGKLKIVQFQDETQLTKTYGSMYRAEDLRGNPIPFQPVENPVVAQGMIEQSNVQPVVEMTRLIAVHRSYEHAQKMIENEHERIRSVIDTIGRPGA